MRGLFSHKRMGVSALVLVALLTFGTAAWGQTATSGLVGVVTDPQGAAVVGAQVTLTSRATGAVRSVRTNEQGLYRFVALAPGRYELRVEVEGFRAAVSENVELQVNMTREFNVTLELGAVTETIIIEEGAAAMNTQDASLGNVFVSSQILQLPAEARNVATLLTLQPGVTPSGEVAGARSDQSNITLDGVDINEAQSSALASPVLRFNSEAIEEFRVTTLNPSASQGRSSAAQINLVTRGGTNEWRGALFHFHRNTIFTANNFFNNRIDSKPATPGHQPLPRPKLIRNTFGGRLGGPIVRDRFFFFYSYEGRRDAREGTAVRVVPLPHLGQGTMRYVGTDGNVHTLTTAQLNAAFPAVGTNPVVFPVLADAAARYPANDFTVGDSQANRLLNTAGFRFNASLPVSLNSHVARSDWNISNSQSLFVRVNAIHDVTGLLPAFPDTPSPNLWSHPWGITASHNWTINPNWVNVFRYGMTRQAFSQLGDSLSNAITFRFIYEPRLFSRTLSRTTPVHNFINDTSWIRNNHTFQFGTNLRITRNNRDSFATAFDTAITNPSFYVAGGTIVSNQLDSYLASQGRPGLVSVSSAQNAATALIGRFTQYTARFTFDSDGSLLAPGSPTVRSFATEDYEMYIMDTWRMRRNLTLTLGLRYSLGRPVYERRGFETKPDIPLGEYFERRIAGAAAGTPFFDPITVGLSGPANNASPMYRWDKNNFQPRVAVAWSPQFGSPFLQALFGRPGKSVIRGGFSMTNDYYGQALAVNFDLNNTLGFSSNTTIAANTFNITDRPAPLFTGLDQNVRPLPFITVPGQLTFPQLKPSDMARRIETSLDENLKAPVNYMWSLTVERELPAGLLFQTSYVGRLGRNLLATRDVMALNNLVDPVSGMDWYTAAGILEQIRQTRPPANFAVPTMPYFDNLFPGMAGMFGPANFTPTQTIFWIMRNFFGNSWTDIQDLMDFELDFPFFFQPQYGALSAWGTFANSNYHGMSVSVRQRLRGVTWDFNYTFAHSLDDASGVQTSAAFGGGFVLNPLRQRDNYSSSDFDLRHVINISGVYDLPIGRGRLIAGSANRAVDAVIGGWQISSIFRWNTGLPVSAPFDDARWSTNWNVQSNATRTRPVSTCVTKGSPTTAPKLFGCDTTAAYQSFRNSLPGETGERNTFRLPGFVNLDLGLTKEIGMPWSEQHKLQLRWEVFNVTNTQRFGAMDFSRTGYGLGLDPAARNLTPPPNWSNFTGIQGSPRVMQIGLRYEF